MVAEICPGRRMHGATGHAKCAAVSRSFLGSDFEGRRVTEKQRKSLEDLRACDPHPAVILLTWRHRKWGGGREMTARARDWHCI